MILILEIIGYITLSVIAILLSIWIVFSVIEIAMEGPSGISENNIFKFILKPFKRITNLPLIFKSASPLQREIMQEEKEIKQLEKQKADMERLDQLKERKEKLFQKAERTQSKEAEGNRLRSLCLHCGAGHYVYYGINRKGREVEKCTGCGNTLEIRKWTKYV